MITSSFKHLLRITCAAAALGTGLLATAPAMAKNTSAGIDKVPVCMNFSCKKKLSVSLSLDEWNSISNWLKPAAADAPTERENIKNAIGWMEVIIGRHTPTHRDVGGDLKNPGALFPGQLDCIDESMNTTAYMKMFEDNGLLKYHKVVERAYRSAIFSQHWAGQIEVIDTGERWVVDSWFQNNGYLPYLQTTNNWEDINIFRSANLDSSQPWPEEEGSFFSRLFN